MCRFGHARALLALVARAFSLSASGSRSVSGCGPLAGSNICPGQKHTPQRAQAATPLSAPRDAPCSLPSAPHTLTHTSREMHGWHACAPLAPSSQRREGTRAWVWRIRSFSLLSLCGLQRPFGSWPYAPPVIPVRARPKTASAGFVPFPGVRVHVRASVFCLFLQAAGRRCDHLWHIFWLLAARRARHSPRKRVLSDQ